MRVVLWLVVAVSVVFSGLWFVGARAARTGAEAALAALRDQGRGDYTDLTVGGFPGRFDVTVFGPRLTDAERGIGWHAPFIEVVALSYNPGHVIAIWPDTQTLTVGPATATIESPEMQASVRVGLSADLPVRDAILDAKEPKVRTDLADVTVAASQVLVAVRDGSAGGPAYDLSAQVRDVTATGADLPPGLDPSPATLTLTARATLDAPLDRRAAEVPPRLTALSVTDLRVTWGRVDLRGKGDLTVGPDGLPEGRIDLTVAQWRDALAGAIATGLVAREVAPTWDRLMDMLARSGADPDTLSVPLDFRSGLMFLGPLPMGPAPRLAP